MDKKIAGLLGAVATLATASAAQAAANPARSPEDILKSRSFEELLVPVPNAAATLRALDELAPFKGAQETELGSKVKEAYHHHHHHHHHHWRHHHHHHHWWRHHHHHHHHHGY
jgi:hypothetical protein